MSHPKIQNCRTACCDCSVACLYDIMLGSIVTGLLFTIGKTALAFYFSQANPASVYGVAGTIILMLLWVSYSSMILFFGAEFTAAYATIYSGEVPPSDIAKKVTE